MRKASRTFQTRVSSGESPRALARRLPGLGPGQLGILIGTKELGAFVDALAEELAASTAGTWILSSADAVWTEQGALSGEPGLVTLVFPGAECRLVTGRSEVDFTTSVKAESSGRGGETVLLLCGPDADAALLAEGLNGALGDASKNGFGGQLSAALAVVRAQRVERPELLALFIPRHLPGRITSSTACRLISPIVRVTGSNGRMLTGLDDAPAMEMLQQVAARPDDPGLLLLAIASEHQALSTLGRNIVARPIAGLDPERGALVIEPGVPIGTRVALATRDRDAAQADLERHLGALAASSRSAAPIFGLFLSSAGRRREPLSLEGEHRQVAARFAGIPLFGFTTTRELSPFEERLSEHVYAGVLALFSALH